MPATSAFLKGFSLVPKLNLEGYSLANIRAEHVEISRFRQYQFPITLTFNYLGNGTPDINKFALKFNSLLSQNHVINSQYGNPYQCYFISMNYQSISSDHRTLVIDALGEAVRI